MPQRPTDVTHVMASVVDATSTAAIQRIEERRRSQSLHVGRVEIKDPVKQPVPHHLAPAVSRVV